MDCHEFIMHLNDILNKELNVMFKNNKQQYDLSKYIYTDSLYNKLYYYNSINCNPYLLNNNIILKKSSICINCKYN
jgi:hypothetical protein